MHVEMEDLRLPTMVYMARKMRLEVASDWQRITNTIKIATVVEVCTVYAYPCEDKNVEDAARGQ